MKVFDGCRNMEIKKPLYYSANHSYLFQHKLLYISTSVWVLHTSNAVIRKLSVSSAISFIRIYPRNRHLWSQIYKSPEPNHTTSPPPPPCTNPCTTHARPSLPVNPDTNPAAPLSFGLGLQYTAAIF